MPFEAAIPNRPMPGDLKYQQAMADGDQERFALATSLAEEEYRHPECERAGALEKQRSFCFHHDEITDMAILVIHGWTACPFEMRELGERLYQQGHNVYGARLAGHGTRVEEFAKSGREDWEMSARKGLTIASLLGRRVVIVGESMGGALAAILAAGYPWLVSKIILCAPCFRILDKRAGLTVFRLVRHFLPETDLGVLPDWQKDYWYSKVPTTGVAELVRIAKKARETGPKITAATLIIQAENDRMVNPGGAHRFFQSLTQLTRGQKRLFLFTDGHHNLTVDLNPKKDQVFQWITEFIG